MRRREKRGGLAGAVLHARLEVVRADAGLPEHPNQAMAANSVEQEIQRKGSEEENDQTDAQVSRCLCNRLAEDIAQPDPSPGPCHGAHDAVADKPRSAHLCRTG